MKQISSMLSWIVILAGISIATYAYASLPRQPERLPERLCNPTIFDGITVEELIERGRLIDPDAYGTVEQALDLSE